MDRESFHEKSIGQLTVEGLKSLVILLFQLTIPVVDEDEGPQRGWCQYLHVLQCYLTPIFIALATDTAFISIAPLGIELWALALILGGIMALALLCSSSPTEKPIYQPLLAFLGFASAVVWIYFIANEIVTLLKTVGVIFGLSDAILGKITEKHKHVLISQP